MESYLTDTTISDILEMSQNIVERVGDCSNLERKVNINSLFWKDVCRKNGLTLQRDCFFSKARIVDNKGIQKGNGSFSSMKEKFDRLVAKDFLRAGDVIGISRGPYEHYAIYAGNNRVIHYAGENADFKGRVSIHEAPFEEFLKNNSDFFVISFEGRYPVKIHRSTEFIADGYFDSSNIKWKGTYSPEETLKRAYSRIGESRYSVISNNCEHFALWCKTGSSESAQVRMIAKYLFTTGIGFRYIAESKNEIASYLAG